MSVKATDKQVRYAFYLLNKAGYRTQWMNAEYKRLGAKMRERSGSVEYWLKNLDIYRMSEVIDKLKEEIGE